jgi:hypothetical protein
VRTGGAPNKNIGDAFLCVWKIVAEAKTYNMRDLNLAIRSMPLTMSTAAMSPAQLEAMRNEARKEEDDNRSSTDRNNSMDDESNVSARLLPVVNLHLHLVNRTCRVVDLHLHLV